MRGRGWIAVLVLLGIITGIAIATGYSLLWKTTYFLMVLIGVSWLWSWVNVRNVSVERITPDQRAQIGQVVQERISVRNTSPVPKPWVEIRDLSDLPGHRASQVVYLGPHESKSWRIRTTCTRRGRFTLGPIVIGSSDPAGLFPRERRVMGTGTILVYPRTVDLTDFVLPGGELSGDSRIKTRTHAMTPNAAGLREYQPGDALARIHWLSTAKTGRMMVKEFELDPSSEVWIILDMDSGVNVGDGDESTEEYAVTAAASIARRLIESNRSVGLITYGNVHEIVHTDRGDRQLQKMLESLSLIHATGKTPLAEVIAAEATRFGRNTTLIIISPSSDIEWVRSLNHQIHRGVQAVSVLVNANSFGAMVRMEDIESELALLNIRPYHISQGVPLDMSLATRGTFRSRRVA